MRTFKNKKTNEVIKLNDNNDRNARWIQYYEDNENYSELMEL